MNHAQRMASEATRLLCDPILADAFEQVRMDALIALSVTDASDTKEILRQQAIANCLNDVVELLKAKIIASGQSDGGEQIETPPTA